MEKTLRSSLHFVCSSFNKNNVEYMVVGGTAVALHGHFRNSMSVFGTISEKLDIDIWYNPTYNNYFNVLNALKSLGLDVEDLLEEQQPDPSKSFFRFEYPEFTLDILPTLIIKVTFAIAYKRREVVELDDVSVGFIKLSDLIENKTNTGRDKDLKDIDSLKQPNKK